MAASAAARGAVIRTNAAVEGVLVEGGRADGVVLETGETIRARAVSRYEDRFGVVSHERRAF
jgi:phytoene dehydrogenase-like protein